MNINAETLLCHMSEIEEYFDNRADSEDGSYGIPEPNKEMRLLQETRAAIELIKDLIDRAATERTEHEATIKHCDAHHIDTRA